MLASLLIVFREVLEAGLIVGVVLAATAGVPHRLRWIAGGIGAGVLGAVALAGFAGAVADSFEGMGQEVLGGTILLFAAFMLAWHTIWMARHGREAARQAREAGRSAAQGSSSMMALAIVVAAAVLREGAEVVLFLYGLALSGSGSTPQLLGGGLLGIAGGGALSWLLYRGLLAVPLRQLFAVIGALITVMAAGMAGSAFALLATAGVVPAWGDQIWDTSGLLADSSIVGKALHALVGYSDRPMGIQLAVFAAVLGGLVLATRRASRPAAPARAAALKA